VKDGPGLKNVRARLLAHPDADSADRRDLPAIKLSVATIAILLLAFAARVASRLFVPIAFGLLVSYALEPPVAALERKRVPRWLGAIIVMLLATGSLGLGAYALWNQANAAAAKLPVGAQQLRELLQQHSLVGGDNPVTQVQRAAEELKQLSEPDREPSRSAAPRTVRVEPRPFTITEYLWSSTATLLGIVADAVVVFFLAFYLLLTGDLFRRRLIELAGPTLSQRKITIEILNDISAQVSRYLFIRVLISLFVAFGTGFGLLAIHMSQPGVWGVVAGLMNVIPYGGPILVTLSIALAALVQFKTASMALVAGGVAATVALLEAYAVTPWLTSRAAEMNPVAVFVGLVFWGWLWGIPGLLMAVPLIMIAKTICDHVEALRPVATLLKAPDRPVPRPA
jgi:predicted PurR-regulated permease PerM